MSAMSVRRVPKGGAAAPVLLLAVLVSACGGSTKATSQDAGPQDAGPTGSVDSGTAADSGSGGDAGSMEDGGTAPDAGTVEDGGAAHDGGVSDDAGLPLDGGGSAECVSAADCPGSDTECVARTCEAGRCGVLLSTQGQSLSTQTAGDCQRAVCDGNGGVESVPDDSDVEDDHNDCTADSCSGGVPRHVALQPGSACAQGTCDGLGACVECLADSDCGAGSECAAWSCIANVCVPSLAAFRTPLSAQTAGDCQVVVCDGSGGITSLADDGDLPIDLNTCTQDLCQGGVPSNSPVASGQPCEVGSALVCDGAGQCVGCVAASDCPGTDGLCASRVCTQGTCGLSLVPAGTPVGTQSSGDCQVTVCDGAGVVTSLADNTDHPSDSNSCTDDTCSAGVPTFVPLTPGTSCGPGLACNANAECVSPTVDGGTADAGVADAGTPDSGPPVECVSPTDCVGADSECATRTCIQGRCGESFAPAGQPLAAQATGDCRVQACDGQGGIEQLPDDTDLPNDSNPCTVDSCSNGLPQYTPLSSGSSCPQGVCDSSAHCVACVVDSDCGASSECASWSCVQGSCLQTLVAANQLLAMQVAGDCHQRVCDGMGQVVSVVDDTDLPVDQNVCTLDICTAGAPSNPPAGPGVACGAGNALVCDGAGSCVGCVSPLDCPGADGPCATRTCATHACGIDYVPTGTPIAGQTAGDCQQLVCNGAGAVISQADDSDLPLDSNPCTLDTCTAGVPANAPVSVGTNCGTNLACDASAACVTSPDAALYALALADYSRGAYGTARGEFDSLVTSYPSSPFLEASLVYVAQCDYLIGDYASADTELESFVATYPSSTEEDRALYWLGRTRRVLKDFQGAVTAFQKVLSDYPASALRDAAQFWLGRSFYDLTAPDYASALAAFKTVIGDFPTSTYRAEAQYWLGRTEFQQGSFAQARVDLQAQLTTYGASNTFADIVSVYIGRCDFELGNYSLATSELTAVPVNYPTSTSLDLAEYWLGRTLFAQASYTSAQIHFEHVVATWPASTIVDNAAYYDGRCAFALRNYTSSLSILQTAEMSWPGSNMMDWILDYEGRSEFQLRTSANPSVAAAALPAAETYFTRQLAGWPTAASAPSGYYWRGRTRYAAQDYSGAISDFDAVTNTPAFATSTWRDNAWAYKVRAYADQSLCTKADAAYASLKAISTSGTLINSTCNYYRPNLCPGTCP